MSFRELRDQAATHREAALHRARGGAVSDAEEDRKEVAAGVHAHEKHLHKGEKETPLKRGGAVDGAAPKKRLDRYAAGGRTKKKGTTTVNVIVAPGGGGGAQPVPVPHPVPVPVAGPPPGMPPGMSPRPMPGGLGAAGPMPPGGPPGMPMRARGGPVKMTAGAEGGMGRLEKTRMVE